MSRTQRTKNNNNKLIRNYGRGSKGLIVWREAGGSYADRRICEMVAYCCACNSIANCNKSAVSSRTASTTVIF